MQVLSYKNKHTHKNYGKILTLELASNHRQKIVQLLKYLDFYMLNKNLLPYTLL